ncbi:MAG: hypothetical protein NT018_00615, partial [Armatimonadetes bacterium]|nr:hypothetical protein [Armatimonadota bacterium]
YNRTLHSRMISTLGEQSIGPRRRMASVRYPECICQLNIQQWHRKSQAQAWEHTSSSFVPIADLPHIWSYIDQAPLQSIESRYRHSDIIAAQGSIFAAVVNESVISEVAAKASENCSRNKALFRLAGSFQESHMRAGSDIKSRTHGYYDASALMERDSNFGRRSYDRGSWREEACRWAMNCLS